MTTKHDPVNRPSHYTTGRKHHYMDVVDDWGLDHYRACVLKYLCRAGRKRGESKLKAALKAQWYVNRWVRLLQKEQGGK